MNIIATTIPWIRTFLLLPVGWVHTEQNANVFEMSVFMNFKEGIDKIRKRQSLGFFISILIHMSIVKILLYKSEMKVLNEDRHLFIKL